MGIKLWLIDPGVQEFHHPFLDPVKELDYIRMMVMVIE